MAADDYDALIANKIYPEAEAIFSARLRPLNDTLDDANFVLDTNTLLLPYKTGSDTLEQLREVYQKLSKEERLFIPGQVAREFAKWRPQMLADIVKNIENARSQSTPPLGTYPLLEDLAPFSNSRKLQTQIRGLRKEMVDQLKDLLNTIRSWAGDDPVSRLYSDFFHGKAIVDPKLDEQKVKSEFNWRMLHGIPPGNKDSKKDDGGIGDYLIWKTILNLGEQRKKPTIFVSGDDKSDWRYQANKKGVYPRYELVDEYRRASNGCTFHILQFSQFLSRFDTPAPIIAQIKNEESEQRLARVVLEDQLSLQSNRNIHSYAEEAVQQYLQSKYDRVIRLRGFPDFAYSPPRRFRRWS